MRRSFVIGMLVALACIGGAVLAARAGGVKLPRQIGRCDGNERPCTHCTNCRYCGYCAKRGGVCSVKMALEMGR